MKKTTLCWLLLFSTILLMYCGCSNESIEQKPPQQNTPEQKPLTAPPISKAGVDQTISLPENSITLNGSDSTDPENNISTYFWTKKQGPSSFTISTPSAVQTIVSNLIEGTYLFELTVTDTEGNSSKDDCFVTVVKNRIYLSTNDIQLILPIDYCLLQASYSNNNSIKHIIWSKTSGPSSYILESPNSLITKVSKLVKGIYEFELAVTDKFDSTTKEKVKIIVGEISANPTEKIFNNLSWYCPWDCYIEIINIYSHLPSGSVFRVYIQRNNSATWEEAVPWSDNFPNDPKYYYFLNSGHLTILPFNYDTFDEKATNNIKLIY